MPNRIRKKWYAAKTGNIHDQGLIIHEITGNNIAVAYDQANAPLLAAAPDLLEALKGVMGTFFGTEHKPKPHPSLKESFEASSRARAAIRKAEEVIV